MILFLDFDGVLHPLQRSEPDFCRLPLLWEILRACPDMDVVFSTSWRETYHPEKMIKLVTYGGGEDLAHRFIGSNPRTPRARSTYIAGAQPTRHVECERWLDENGQQHRAWLAIDDMPEIFPPNSPTLYLVDGNTGLTDADVLAIIERMNSVYENCDLMKLKRARQEQDRADVRAGIRTDKSMALFSKKIAREVKIEYRDVDYDDAAELKKASPEN
jgi:hypothetical protein